MLEEEIIPNGHKAIIFSQWSTIAKDLGIELSEYDPIVITGEVPPEQRQRLVDNFQTNPHCKVAIGTIGAMGTGLTLNKASYVFFMDKAWNSGDNAQAEDRAHRIGTVGAVNVISMVAKGTIDEAVEDYLLENKDLIDRVVDGKGSKQDIKTMGDTIKPRLVEAGADLSRVMVIDDSEEVLTLSDDRIEKAVRQNHVRLVIIDPVQAFIGADVDMNRANEVRPVFRKLGMIAEKTSCAIVLIGHLNKSSGTQSTYRGLGSIDIMAAVRSLIFIGKVRKDPTTRVLIHEKSSLAPPGETMAFKLGDEEGFRWVGAYEISADELLDGKEGKATETKLERGAKLIQELLVDKNEISIRELDDKAKEQGISGRTMRDVRSRMKNELEYWINEKQENCIRLKV